MLTQKVHSMLRRQKFQTILYQVFISVAVRLIFSDITATGNQEYGLQCVDVVSQVCSNMNLAGNTLGEQTFCDSSCGQEAQSEKIDDDGDGYTEEMGDCNDDPNAGGADIYPVDNDGDGFDMCNDCDDNNALTYPGVASNEADPSLCYRDMDMDGFGDNAPSNPNCYCRNRL